MSDPVSRLVVRYLQARTFSSPEALKRYLQKHPKADPSKHSVKGKPKEESKGKAESKKQDKPEAPKKPDSGGLDALKGLDKGQRKRVLERALENLEAESQGRAPRKMKDVSKQEGFEALKDLSHSEQQKVIQKALKGL